MDITVNYPAILVAAIAGFAVGFLWHGPLFGKQWVALMGITKKQIAQAQAKGGMWKPMLWALAGQIVTAAVLAPFLKLYGAMDVQSALIAAFWPWLGFIAVPFLNGVLWENKSVKLYLFSISYYLVMLWVMSVILTLWR